MFYGPIVSFFCPVQAVSYLALEGPCIKRQQGEGGLQLRYVEALVAPGAAYDSADMVVAALVRSYA